jgi:hypothetical protein
MDVALEIHKCAENIFSRNVILIKESPCFPKFGDREKQGLLTPRV